MTEMTGTKKTGQDDVPGQGEKTVPLAALQAETRKRQELATQLAELRGRVEGMATAPRPADEPKKELTRADLKRAVADDKITEDEADALWEQQITRKAAKAGADAAKETMDSGTLQSRVSGEIARYKGVISDLDDKESAAYRKVAGEFKHLAGLGYDRDDLRTEVAALRAAFGPIESLESTERPRAREGHQETGGRGGEADGGDGRDGYPRGFPDRMRAHYDKMIERGIYRGKDDPTLKREIDRWKARNPSGQARGRSRAA